MRIGYLMLHEGDWNGRMPNSRRDEVDRVSLERLFAAVTERYVACDGTITNGD